MKRFMLFALVFGLIVMVGCSKDTTGPEQEPPVLPENLDQNVVTTPTDAPDQVKFYGGPLNTFRQRFQLVFQQWRALIQTTEAKFEDGKWVWEQTQNNFTIRLVAWMEDDGTQKWELYFDGTDPDTKLQFNNVKVLEASLSPDGKSGTFKVYDPVTNTPLFTYSWTVADNGTVQATLETSNNERIEVVNRPDGSGSLEVYINDVKRLEASWDADGNGTWTAYDENGQQIGTGNWGPGGVAPPDVSTTLETAVVEVPDNAPSNVRAMGAPYFAFHNLFKGWHQWMKTVMLQGRMVHQDTTWTWEVSANNLTIRLVVTVGQDSSKQWALYFDGTDASGNTYNNWKAMEGWISADEKSGTLTLYETNSTNVLVTYEWTIDDQGNVSAEVQTSDGYRIVAQKNADGSGFLKFYLNNVLRLEIYWNADRSGNWKAYDENGNLINQGSWG
ncbi:MAG: hypothetical protein GXO78_10835 [Calditrichaeota bacterium]|nr:hypothetical protein [Calditrichota bacterium]